jgi:hypothetical protein
MQLTATIIDTGFATNIKKRCTVTTQHTELILNHEFNKYNNKILRHAIYLTFQRTGYV